MADDVDIVNRALIRLGVAKITALSDTNDRAISANTLFEPAVRTYLSDYPWRFAMKKSVSLTAATAPTNEWSYAHTLPADLLGGPHALFASTAKPQNPFKDFEVFDGLVYSNQPTVYIDYVYRKATASWPVYFEELMVKVIGWQLAETLTEQTSKAQQLMIEAIGNPEEQGKGGYYRQARQADAKTGGTQAFSDFTLISARQGGYTPGRY
jgi:hypothetical protein